MRNELTLTTLQGRRLGIVGTIVFLLAACPASNERAPTSPDSLGGTSFPEQRQIGKARIGRNATSWGWSTSWAVELEGPRRILAVSVDLATCESSGTKVAHDVGGMAGEMEWSGFGAVSEPLPPGVMNVRVTPSWADQQWSESIPEGRSALLCSFRRRPPQRLFEVDMGSDEPEAKYLPETVLCHEAVEELVGACRTGDWNRVGRLLHIARPGERQLPRKDG